MNEIVEEKRYKSKHKISYFGNVRAVTIKCLKVL